MQLVNAELPIVELAIKETLLIDVHPEKAHSSIERFWWIIISLFDNSWVKLTQLSKQFFPILDMEHSFLLLLDVH